MNFDRSSEVDPAKRILYRTTEIMSFLGISHGTLRKAIARLGFTPRKRYGSSGKWYSHDEVMRIFASIYTPWKHLRSMFSQREARWYKRMYKTYHGKEPF